MPQLICCKKKRKVFDQVKKELFVCCIRDFDKNLDLDLEMAYDQLTEEEKKDFLSV